MEDGSSAQSEQWTNGQEQEKINAQFYECYCKTAEEYDRKFTESYHKKMNKTVVAAGLFSITTLAFIRDINSQLRPDPNEKTITLLCDIFSGMGSTVCDNFHVAPQRSDLPPAIIQTQAMLCASFTAFMFSAFIAMLGKQWLYHYTSAIDIQGSPTERGQNRQREFDHLATRHFHRVMQLPLFMLQVGISLCICALARYLWNTNTTLTWIILGSTSIAAIRSLSTIVLGRPS